MSTAQTVDPRSIVTLSVDRIRPMKGQPRSYFNKRKLAKLSKSLQRAGQKLPILVHPVDNDPKHDFEIIDGERRWRSKKKVGDKRITAIVVNAEDLDEYFEISAIANFGREDHTPLEIARALQQVRTRRIRQDGSCTEADLAEMFAQSPTWVSHHLSLLNLIPEVRVMVDPELPPAKRLNRSAAVQVSRLPARMQLRFAQRVVKERLNMNEIRMEVRRDLEHAAGSQPVVFRGRPSDRYRNFSSMFRNFNSTARILLAVDRGELRAAFGRLSQTDRSTLSTLAREHAELSAQLQGALQSLLKC